MRRQRNVGGGQERNGSPQEIGEEIKKKTAIQGIMIDDLSGRNLSKE
jgi:hypothetical protein